MDPCGFGEDTQYPASWKKSGLGKLTKCPIPNLEPASELTIIIWPTTDLGETIFDLFPMGQPIKQSLIP